MNARAVQADTMGWALIGPDERAVIVLKVERGDAYVVWGTGTTGRRYPYALIEPACRVGRVLRLKKPTAFYGTNTRWIPISSIQVHGKCHGKALLDVHQAVQDAAPQLPPAQLVQQPSSPNAPSPASPQLQAPVDSPPSSATD